MTVTSTVVPAGANATVAAAPGAPARDAIDADASTDARVDAARPAAPPLFARALPRGVRAAQLDEGEAHWPRETERESSCSSAPDGITEWYRFGSPELQVQVFAEATLANEPPRDARAWGLALAARERPAIDLTPVLLPGLYFQAFETRDHRRNARMRLQQVRWRLDPCEDDLVDVVVAYTERAGFTYRVYLVMPAGWSWWDQARWPEGPIPPSVRARARAAWQQWIASLDR